MNGSSSTYLNNGSRMLIQGAPSPLEFMLFALGDAPDILARAVATAVEDEVAELRNNLGERNPLYAAAPEAVDIAYDEQTNSFEYTIASEYASRARAIEYGGPTSPARPVLRKEAIRSAKRLEKSIQKNIDKELGK